MNKNVLQVPVEFKIKALGDEDEDSVITIEGFANTTTVDRAGDMILEEAWTKGGLDNYLKNPIILAYHDHEKPIGKMAEYYVNNKGLKIVANIYKSAGSVYSLVKEGVLQTFSVGFALKDAVYDSDKDLFIIKDLELAEISVVSVPMNADSTFSVRKSFETDEEYNSFKSGFVKDTKIVKTENVSKDNSDKNEETNMDKLELDMRAKIEKEIADAAIAQAEVTAMVTKQVQASMGAVSATTVEVVGERVEALQTVIDKKFADDSVALKTIIEELRTELKDNSESLVALTKNKMTFLDKGQPEGEFTQKEMETAVLVSTILGKGINDTKYGQTLVAKSAQQHIDDMTSQDWETSFSTRLLDDIRERLIVEDMFASIAMPTPTLNLPLNPEAAYGTWVTNGQLNAATSSGTVKVHKPLDTTITAFKLATKELLGYEEEDDALIALVPLIRDAAVRRTAKSSDKALLIGNTGVSAGTGEGNYPFNGLATIGSDAGRTVVIGGTVAAPTKVTVADLQGMRRPMGVHGHNPSELVYVVSHTVYYDLLDDPDFRTMEKVGANATILTGQIGQVGGTPVVVSAEFAAEAVNVASAICVNMSNYIKGEYKGLRVERERSVENQTNLLVVTRRFGMLEIFPSNATVVTLVQPST